jgi:Kef-type K+ transport system membrane component KefB
MAGAVVKLVDRDRAMTHPFFRQKLEAAGYGVFIPFFFVASGLKFDLDALFEKTSTLALVPVFLLLLLAARGLPALLYRSQVDGPRVAAAGLLQATSLGFVVVAGQLGVELDLLRPGVYAAFVAAGLLSVLLFPLGALTILRRGRPPERLAVEPAARPL